MTITLENDAPLRAEEIKTIALADIAVETRSESPETVALVNPAQRSLTDAGAKLREIAASDLAVDSAPPAAECLIRELEDYYREKADLSDRIASGLPQEGIAGEITQIAAYFRAVSAAFLDFRRPRRNRKKKNCAERQ